MDRSTPETLMEEEPCSSDEDKISFYNSSMFLIIRSRKPEPIMINEMGLQLERGASVNAKNKSGDTILHVAVRKKLNDLVHYLLKKGADKDVTNVKGMTPLSVAQECNNITATELLTNKQTTVETMKISNFECSSENVLADNFQLDGSKNGKIFELLMLMTLFERGHFVNVSFSLGKEVQSAGKFDDVVFKFAHQNKQYYIFMQLKHIIDESKKLTSNNLLTYNYRNSRKDNILSSYFNLQKYFVSFLSIRKIFLNKDSEILKHLLIFTNIGLDINELNSSKIGTEKLDTSNSFLEKFLNLKIDNKSSAYYKLHVAKESNLYKELLESSNLKRLSKTLLSHVLNEKLFTLDCNSLFNLYHVSLSAEVIDVKNFVFKEEFIEGVSLSEEAFLFRKTFLEMALQNENKTEKEFWIDLKLKKLKIVKNFGKQTDKYANHKLPTDHIVESDIEDFFDKLILAVDQPNCNQLSKLILNEDLRKYFNLINTDIIMACLKSRIQNWISEQTDKEGWISDEKSKEFFSGFQEMIIASQTIGITAEYKSRIKNSNIQFKSPVEGLDRFFLECEKQNLIINTGLNCTLISAVKVYQYLEAQNYSIHDDSHIIIDNKILNADVCHNVLQSFCLRSNKLLVVELDFILSENLEQLIDSLCNITEYFNDKKLIIITKNVTIATDILEKRNHSYSVIHDDMQYTLKDFTLKSQNFMINFQGKFVNFYDLIGKNINFSELPIDSKLITKFILKECPEIGNKMPSLEIPTNYFMKRKLINRQVKVKVEIFDCCNFFHTDKICTDSNQIIQIDFHHKQSCEKCTTQRIFKVNDNNDIKKLCKQYKLYNIHLLCCGEKNTIYWEATYGSLINLRPFCVTSVSNNCDLTEFESRNKVQIISDAAGMGKSVFVTQLCIDIKENYNSDWVIYVDLRNLMNIFMDETSKRNSGNPTFSPANLDDTITFFIKILGVYKNDQSGISDFEKELIKHRLITTGKIIAVFDGFDEMCPSYVSVVTDLLKGLKETKLDRLTVTTRPYLQEFLENELGCFSQSLLPFSQQEQKKYLSKYLSSQSKSDVESITENILTHVTHVLPHGEMIVGVPLLLKILSELLLENIDFERLYHSFNLAQLFHNFVCKKINIYESKSNENKGNISLIASKKFFSSCLLEHHINLSFQLLFIPEVVHMLTSQIYQFNELIEQEISKVGIVEITDGRINFIHHIFAEYFAAKFFVNELSANNRKVVIHFIFTNIFIVPQYQVIRSFMNAILTETCISSSNLNSCGTEMQHLLSKSLLKNDENQTILHIACKESNVHIVKFIINCLKHTQKYASFFKNYRDMNGWTALHFAISVKNIDIVKALVEENIDIKLRDKYGKTALQRVIESDLNSDDRYWRDIEVVQYLIEGDESVLVIKDIYDKTILFRALQLNKWCIFRYLIEKLSERYGELSDGLKFINIALREHYLEFVQCFVEIFNELGPERFTSTSLLHKVTAEGNITAIKFLMKNGADCLSIMNGLSLVHEAIFSDNEEVMGLILNGIDLGDSKKLCEYINFKDSKGDSPLMWGAEGNRLRSTKFLLEKYGKMVYVSCQNNKGNTALHWAVKKDNFEIIKLLLDFDAKIDVPNYENITPVGMAQESDQIHILSLFKKYSENTFLTEEIRHRICKIIVNKNDGEIGDVEYIVNINREEQLATFLNNCENVEVITINFYKFDEDTLKNLIRNLNNLFLIEINLLYAANSVCAMILEKTLLDINKPLIVQCGSIVYVRDHFNKISVVDINTTDKVDENIFTTILSNSVKESYILTVIRGLISKVPGHIKCNKMSLKTSVFDTEKEFEGWRLVDYAAYNDDILLVKLLSLSDWDLSRLNSDGRRTLEIAAEFSSVCTFDLLINIKFSSKLCLSNKGTKVLQLTNESGNTPLLIAANSGRKDLVNFLIHLGSNIHHKNIKMQTAVELACQNHHYDTVYELLKRDSCFPNFYDLNVKKKSGKHELLFSLVQERKKLHECIAQGDINSVKCMTIHSNSKLCLSPENKSALLTSIECQQFKVYAFLKSVNYKFKDKSEHLALDTLTFSQKHELKNAMLPYFSTVHNSHIMFLVSKSRKLGLCEDFKVFTEKIYSELNSIPEISIVLKIIQFSDYLDIIFDFENDSVCNADPSSMETVKGKCDYKEGRLYIGAKTERENLLGTLAHELTHFAIQIMFDNNCNPFFESDETSKHNFMTIVDNLHLQVKSNSKIDEVIKQVFTVYSDNSEWASEAIVRVTHVLAKYNAQSGLIKLSEQVPDLLNYYKSLMVEMEKFIESNYLIKPRNTIRLLNFYSDEINKIDNINIQFKNLINIQNLIGEKKISVLLICSDSTWLSSIKVYQSLKALYPVTLHSSCLYFKLDQYFKQKVEANKAFYSEACNLFVLECNISLTEVDKNEITIFLNILREKKAKTTILIIKEQEVDIFKHIIKNYNYYIYADVNTKLSDLSVPSQNYILEKKIICFQKHKKLLSIKDLLGEETILRKTNEIIDSLFIVKLVNNEVINIGNDLSEFGESSFYINRILSYQFNQDLTADPSSWKEQCENTGLISENELISKNNKVLIIYDTAGMGKSTLFSYLEHKIKSDDPSIWVVRINLNDCTKILSKIESLESEIGCNETINFIYDKLLNGHKISNSVLERKLFQIYLQCTQKMVLMFDGFDEISPNYKEIVLNLLLALTNTKVKRILVSTRPHLRHELENNLDGFACRLKPFTNKNKVEFLIKFWKSCGKNIMYSDQLKCYANHLVKYISDCISSKEINFTGIPLQIKMLAEVFEDDCMLFCKSDYLNPVFPENMDIVYLYKYFVDKKFRIYQEEKNQVDYSKVGIIEDSEILHKTFLEVHQRLSIYTLFSGKFINMLLSVDEIKKTKLLIANTEKGKERTGIIKGIVQDIPQFIHRTFAEYFVACFLATSLEELISNIQFQKFLLVNILMNEEYEVVRFFFNNLLNNQTFTVQKLSILGKTLSELWRNNKVILLDDTANTILHVTAREGNTSIAKLIVDSLTSLTSIDLNFINAANKYNRIALHDAISYCDTRLIKLLVEAGSDVNCVICDGSTALHGVVAIGNLELVKWFIEKNANIHAVTENGMTLLHSAASSLEVVQWLVNCKDLNVEAINDEGQNMLHYATLLRNFELLKWLIEVKQMKVNIKDSSGQTILHFASSNDLAMVEYIVRKNAIDINDKTLNGMTALHFAVTHENIAVAKFLVTEGANINSPTNDGRTPLHNAAIFRNWNIVKWLVVSGANINAETKKGQTLLLLATQFGTFKEVRWLIENGADINTRLDHGQTVISRYAFFNEWDRVKWLLDHGADVNISDHNGRTMLHSAIMFGDNLSQVRWLVREGANIFAKTTNGETILHCAAQSGNLELVQWLVDMGGQLQEVDVENCTVLHFAGVAGNSSLIKWLVCQGLDMNATDINGNTLMHHTQVLQDLDLVKWLVERGANVNALNNGGSSVLHIACLSKNYEVVKWLVEDMKLDPNLRSYKGEMAHHLSAGCGDIQSVKYLIKEKGIDINSLGMNGDTVLHSAAFSSFELVKWLVENGVNITAVDNNFKTAIDYARQIHNEAIIHYLEPLT